MDISRLHPLFAAEMTGVDLREPLTAELKAAVEQAMADHAVLVVRGQQLDDKQHIRFSREFGPLELPPETGMRVRRLRKELYDASNLDSDGRLLAEDSPRRRYNLANEVFHTDSSFNDMPTKWSLLLAHVIPPDGGNTEFIDTRIVYEEMPEGMRSRIDGLTAEHFLWFGRERAGLREITEDMRRRMPPVQHPLVRVSESGRKALYIGAHASRIIGMPDDEGRKLLDELYAFATQPKFVYSHKWREGDLVIWDNRCTLHRAGEFKTTLTDVRDLRRTTINEYGPERASTDTM